MIYCGKIQCVAHRVSKLVVPMVCAMVLVCSCKSDDMPADIITEDVMVPMLVEMHWASAYFSIEYTDDSIGYSNAVKYTQQEVLKKNGLTLDKFEKSIAYYTDHPEKFRAIYEKVIQQLDQK